MNFRLSLCSAAMLLLSSVGCCHLHSCVDPCDPCSRPLAGCGLSSWMHGEIDAWRSRNQCRNSGWTASDCGCSTCNGQYASYDGASTCAGGNCGSPVSTGSSCSGCAGGTSYPGGMNYPGTGPTPIPADTAPAPPVPVPASEAAARMMMQGRQVVMLPQPARRASRCRSRGKNSRNSPGRSSPVLVLSRLSKLRLPELVRRIRPSQLNPPLNRTLSRRRTSWCSRPLRRLLRRWWSRRERRCCRSNPFFMPPHRPGLPPQGRCNRRPGRRSSSSGPLPVQNSQQVGALCAYRPVFVVGRCCGGSRGNFKFAGDGSQTCLTVLEGEF